MIAYTIHEPEGLAGGPEERADRLRLVREGFAWIALFAPLLWLLYHRMWLVLLVFVVIAGLMEGAAVLAGLSLEGWGVMLAGFLFALHANDLRRWSLARRGYRMTGAVTGRDIGECEYKLYSRWDQAMPPAPAQQRHSATPSYTATPMHRPPAPRGEGPVIGFPDDPSR